MVHHFTPEGVENDACQCIVPADLPVRGRASGVQAGLSYMKRQVVNPAKDGQTGKTVLGKSQRYCLQKVKQFFVNTITDNTCSFDKFNWYGL